MDKEIQINVVTLENGKKYYELKKMLLNNVEYLILSGVEDEDFAVRKLVSKEGKEGLYISKLDSDEELKLVVDTFMKSSKN